MPKFPKAGVLFMGFIALLGWIALSLQLSILTGNAEINGLSKAEAAGRFFGYFTILTNLLAAFNLTLLLSFPVARLSRFFARPSMQSAITVYLLVVSLGYNLLLRHQWQPEGLQFWVDELLHDFIPALYLLYWVLFVLKGRLHFLLPFTWLLYPFIYLLSLLARGRIDGFYPYPFLNVEVIGYSTAMKNAGLLLAGFFLVSLVIVLIDKILFKRKQRTLIN